MSKYYKKEDVISFLNTHCPKEMWEYQMADLPSIEVSDDCIDRYSALAELDPRSYEYKAVKELPSVIPQPKEGEWITAKDSYEIICSRCEYEAFDKDGEWFKPDYCHTCGAKMKGAE